MQFLSCSRFPNPNIAQFFKSVGFAPYKTSGSSIQIKSKGGSLIDKYVGQINYISQELKRENGSREHLFENYTEGVLDEAEYRFAKQKYDDEAAELVKHLIKAVKIYEEKRVEVELNFREQKKVMERIIGEMMEGDSDE